MGTKMNKKYGILAMAMPTLLLAIIIAFSAAPTCSAESEGFSLLLQSSPVSGGSVIPQSDSENMTPNESLTITAVPNEGYRFMYWLGDVADPTTMSTTVLADSPKMVIAVFDRSEFEFIGSDAGGVSSGGGSSGGGSSGPGSLTPNNSSYTTPFSSESGSSPPSSPPPDIYPVPVPEPATIGMFIACVVILNLSGKVKVT